MSRAVRRLLARAARPFSGRRPAASPALPSGSPPRSGFRPRPLFARATACLFAAAFALLLGAGAAEAHDSGPSGHVDFIAGFTPTSCTNNPTKCAHRPTGYAVPGPNEGEITIVWARATTGPQESFSEWRFYGKEIENSPFLPTVDKSTDEDLTTYTFSNLDLGDPYSVGVGIATAEVPDPQVFSQYSIATLKPLSIPTVSSASVNGTSLTITFSENLAAAASLANDAFAVKKTPAGGMETDVTLTGTPSISGKTVTLTLADASAVVHTDTDVKVTYTKPATGTNNKLKSTTEGLVATFTQGVTNSTPSPPTVSSASVRGTSLSIRFNKNLAAAPDLANSAFTVKKTPPDGTETVVTLSGTPTISASTVTLTLADAVAADDTVTVGYTDPGGNAGNVLRSAGSTGPVGRVATFAGNDRLTVLNNTRPPRPPGYSIQCSDYGYWYVHGDISGNPGARSGIACDMAKPGWIFEWNRPGYIKWVYRGDYVVTPYTTSSGSIRTRRAPISGGNARPPVNQPVATGRQYTAFTYIADASNRAVRGADGMCYRERRVSGRWQRSIAYRTDPNNYLEACRKAAWNAHYRWRNRPLVNPDGGTFPSGPPPAPPVFESAAVDGKTLTLTFDANLDRGSVPSPGAFRVTVNNARRNVAAGGVAVSGKTVTLTLTSAVSDTDTVKVRYTKPSARPLQGAAFGKAVATFADQDTKTRESIWSATLTTAEITIGTWQGFGCSGSADPCSSALTKASFTRGNKSYQIEAVGRIMVRIGQSFSQFLALQLDSAIPSGFTLHVGDRRFPVSNASLSNSGKTASWSNPGFTWSVGQQVSLRLTTLPGSGGSGAVAEEPTVVSEGPQPTSVSGVTVASDAGADKTYGLGDSIQVEVTFVGPVEVDTTGGTPRLRIDMDPADWGEKWAEYQSGSGTDTLVFAHTVVEPNLSTQGIAVLENSLELNGGTIGFSSGHAAYLGHTGLAHDDNHKVDWQTEPESGAVGTSGAEPASATGVTVTSSAGDDKTYGIGDTIHVRVTFDGMVDVTGTPRLKIDMDPAEWGEKLAAYESGSGTSSLTFAHTVVEPNISTQGIAVLANSLELNGGTIRSGSVDAALAHTGLGHDANHKVNWQTQPESGGGADAQTADAQPAVEPGGGPVGTSDPPGGASGDGGTSEPPPPPTVTGLEVVSDPGADDTYMMGDTILIRATFSGPVTVTGSPGLKIDMDPAEWGEKRAAYRSGSGTDSLTFAHTVVEPNYSTQGIAVLANSLSGGTILSKDTDANAVLGHTGLGHDSGHKVDWRPAVSVADAQANESGQSGWARGGDGASMAFEVSLGRAFTTAEHRVTVDYATADGTAKAGEDYTATSGTLTFAAGERAKTVRVPILDDAIDEGQETFKVRLSNARGARIGDGEATGTISNDDPLQKMWLSRFGRTVAGHVTDAVSDRLAHPLSGAQVTVGGQTVDLARTEDEAWVGEALTSVARALGAREEHEPGDGPGSGFGAGGSPGTGLGRIQTVSPGGTPAREITGRELLLGSAFHLAREGDGTGPGLAAWGRVTTGGFDGEAPSDGGRLRIDGEVTTGILGADAAWNRLLAGVAISVSEGEGNFALAGTDSGTIESSMTTVSPYARFSVNDRVSVWGLAGWGTGDMTIVQDARAANGNRPERDEIVTRTDLEMRLIAGGGRGALIEADEDGGIDLALKADAFYVETEAEAVSNEGATTAAASRVRLALEGGRAFDMGDGAVLRPSLELGLRHDGGDAETGTGVEIGGGVSYADPGSGLSVEAKARMLVAHADADYREWGATASVRLAPGERGRGLSFSLSPTLGAAGSATDRLWGARDAGGLAPVGAEFEASRGLDAELGYGLSVFGDRFTGTPNLGFGVSDTARAYRIGWRLTSAVRGDPGFEVNLDATRREAANDNGAASGSGKPDHGLMLRAAIRW